MARRSPLNPRYQKHAKVGSTKRSASALKPKREAGASSAPVKKPQASSKPKRSLPALPTSPEIQRWRRIWWVLVGAMIATAAVSYLPDLRQNPTAQRIGMAVLTAAFFPAMYIELVVIRRLRNELIQRQKSEKKGGK